MFVALAAVGGLIFGSFGTVAAHRIPRRENIVTGRSKCPNCDRQIRAVENIPVLSYLMLRGRCGGCRAKIPVRYPLIEAATAILFALAAARFGLVPSAFVFMGFFWALVVLTMIDLDHHLLPDRVVFPTFVAGWIGLAVAALIEQTPGRLLEAALGTAIFGGFFLLVAQIVPAGMGGGDVKLAFVLGTFLGFAGGVGVVLVGMFLSFFYGGLVGVIAMLMSGQGRKMQIPFGPFLAAGTVTAVLVGEWLVGIYTDSLL